MSKEQANAKQAEKPKAVPADDERWESARTQVDGWYAPGKSGELKGRIRGWIQLQTAYGPASACALEVGNDALSVLIKEGQVQREGTLKKGQLVGMMITAGNRDLEQYDRGTVVRIRYKGKKNTDRGPMHDYDIDVWKGTAVARTVNTKPAPEEHGDIDDLPF